ncbi:MAG: hypothetical protein GC204_10765 [Chloroflexi bacterium]|nr:hypothetical protein [Chloroflexota bacterium]
MPLFNRGKSQKSSGSEDDMQAVSLLKPEEVKALGGLPNEAIAGMMKVDAANPKKISPEQFRPNPAFIRLMHEVIKSTGLDDPDLRAAAAQQGEGWIYIIDLRTPEGPQGRVPPEDIVGAFEVKQGLLVQDSYWANDKHILFSAYGLVKLTPFFRSAFIRALKPVKPT